MKKENKKQPPMKIKIIPARFLPFLDAGSVVSDIMGVSSLDMLRAIADGENDPEKLANFARRSMKKKKDELDLALRGYINLHQRLMLKTILTHIEFLTEQIDLLNQEVATRLSSYQEDIERRSCFIRSYSKIIYKV